MGLNLREVFVGSFIVSIKHADRTKVICRFYHPPCRRIARQTVLLGEFAVGGVESRSIFVCILAVAALRAVFPRTPFGTAVDARVDLVHGDAWVVYVKEVDSNPTHIWSFRREMMSDVRDVWDERTVGRMVRWVEVHEFCEKC
jgi:hypothetical protein